MRDVADQWNIGQGEEEATSCPVCVSGTPQAGEPIAPSPAAPPAAARPRTAPDVIRADSLAAGVVIMLILTVVQRLVGFLRGILFCRWLDADQLGQWDMAFGFLMLAAPLAVLGLPGSFGRYVEYYRQQGQLRTFLRRTVLCSLGLTVLAVAAVLATQGWCSELIFGTTEQTGLVAILAVTLAVVIVYNFLVSLFTALRQYRLVSGMQFANSLIFAAGSIGLLLAWQVGTASVVLGFGISYAAVAVFGVLWLAPMWKSLSRPQEALSQRSFWARLMPFAFWLWVTNWLSNLFEITDRFMILHFSGLESVEALGLVGQYFSARVVPALFIGVAEMLSTMVTPQLSADWEAGRRREVSERLGLVLKLMALAMVAAAAVVLAAAPLLFSVALQNKYAGGESILPWVLACSIWTSLAFVTYNYLWCAEKSRYVNLSVAVGLGVSISLNYLLLPSLGLAGAVIASSIARVVLLALVWTITRRHGMHIDRSLILVAVLPLVLGLGPWITLVVLAAALLDRLPGIGLFNPHEKKLLGEFLRSQWFRARMLVGA